MTILASLCILLLALVILGVLSLIDLRRGILPDKLVLAFLLTGAAFHYVTHFLYAGPPDMLAGALLGGGLLFAVRLGANFLYKQDALGLGDVKLLAAAGAWLGPHHVAIAIIAGALAGLAHGLGLAAKAKKAKKRVNLKTFSLPAGPGFAAGIVIAGIMKFRNLFDLLS